MSAKRLLSVLFALVTLALIAGGRASISEADTLTRVDPPQPTWLVMDQSMDSLVDDVAPTNEPSFKSTAAAASSAALPALTWQIETVDSGDSLDGLGRHSSIALDSAGRIHVGYYDAEHQDLKYASYDGSQWILETVTSEGDVGQYASLALDSNDHPHISYYDATHTDLKLASLEGETWRVTLLDGVGDVGQHSSLALDADDWLHVSYYDASRKALKYLFLSESTRSGKLVDGAGEEALFSSLALRSDGQPCVTYVVDDHEVKCACRDAKDWAISTVYENPRNVVAFTSLAWGVGNRPHVSFYVGPSLSAPGHALIYATLNRSDWQTEIVDNVGAVGWYPSLALDPAGQPHISYYGDGALKYAYPFGGDWYARVVDSSGDVGTHTSLELDGRGQPHIVYRDETKGDLKYATDVPIRFQRLVAQLVAEMRGTGMALGWESARLGPGVERLYRPDVEGVAYYEFPVVAPGLAGALAPAGFVIVSTGDHDTPIPHWDFSSWRPSIALKRMSKDAERVYKLDALSYVAEDRHGALAARLGALPLKVSGFDPSKVFDMPGFETIWSPGPPTDTDVDTGAISPTVYISGTLAPPTGLEREGWASWTELKNGFGASYAPWLQALREEAREAWKVVGMFAEGGILSKGDTRTLAALWPSPSVSLAGEAVERGFVASQLLPTGSNMPPNLRITALDSSLGATLPFTVTVSYPNGVTERFSFQIVEPYETWLPLVLGGDLRLSPTAGDVSLRGQRAASVEPQVVNGWTEWSYVWAGGDAYPSHSEQRWYEQLAPGELPNTSGCYSGCGATAWAMLFGWVDYQAHLGDDPYWEGRWGLYREGGGPGPSTPDAVAPSTMDNGDNGVRTMTWEIRNCIDTWCSPLPGDDNAATWATDMQKARKYVVNRSNVRVHASGNNLNDHKLGKYRRKAKTAIKYRGPAIIGIGFWEHYPLAYGFAKRQWKDSFGTSWSTERMFYTNCGWGSGKYKGWIRAFPIWFAGEVRSNRDVPSPEIDDVAVHRASDHQWYYDIGHDGDTDTLSPAWGKQAGDIPLAGDFDRDGFVDDTAIYRLDNSGNGRWHYSYDHDGGTDEQSGPWSWGGDRPLVGDFDRDGYVDDMAVYRPSTHVWYYDYDHNGSTDDTSGPWGGRYCRPFAGDFDRDGRVDDVAVFRPTTRVVYYDYDHDGSTDEEVTYWTSDTSLPVAGDFDRDGYVDDVGFFIPDWEPISLWLFDHDHDGSYDDILEWGWEDALPVAGAFGEDMDPYEP